LEEEEESMKTLQVRRAAPFLMVAVALSLAPVGLNAQAGRGAPAAPANAKAAAPVDLTGQ